MKSYEIASGAARPRNDGFKSVSAMTRKEMALCNDGFKSVSALAGLARSGATEGGNG